MTARRTALLIASDRYRDSGLSRLKAPESDVEALAAVLRDQDIAGFEVRTLVNEPHHVVGEAIGDFYRDQRRDDLSLLYFTGHGLKDSDGRLYFAMTNTRRDSLLFTSLAAEQIRNAMQISRSRQIVLLLDCCYSGAFPADLSSKASTELHTLEALTGRGRIVLTASDAMQYSFEGDQIHGDGARSLFTHFLIEGLRDGSADLDGDGSITLDELYDYVHDRVVDITPSQRPMKQDNVQGRIVIARNANWRPPEVIPQSRLQRAPRPTLRPAHSAIEPKFGSQRGQEGRSQSAEVMPRSVRNARPPATIDAGVILRHSSHVSHVSFSADGNWLVTRTTEDDDEAIIWSVPAGQEHGRVPGAPFRRLRRAWRGPRDNSDWHRLRGGFVVACPPAAVIATVLHHRGIVQLTDLNVRTTVGRFRLDGPITALQVDRLGNNIAAASTTGRVSVWNIRAGRVVMSIMEATGGQTNSWDSTVLAIDDIGRHVACQRGGETRVFLLSNGAEHVRLASDFRVNHLQFMPSGHLLSADNDQILYWDLSTGVSTSLWTARRRQGYSNEPDETLYRIAISQDGSRIAGAIQTEYQADQTSPYMQPHRSHRYEIATFDAVTRRELARWPLAVDPRHLQLNNNGQLLATGGTDRVARVWDVSSGSEINGVRHVDIVSQAAISPDGRWLASASADVWITPLS